MIERLSLIFALLLIGFLMRLSGRDYSNALISFILYVSFPAVIIERMHESSFEVSFFLVSALAIFSVLVGGFLGYLAARVMNVSQKTTGTFMLVCALGNTSFVGFPFIEALYGNSANITYAIFFDQFGSFFALMTLGTIVSVAASGQKTSVAHVAKEIVTFAPFVALMVALILKPVGYPSFLLTLSHKLSPTLIPLVTIAVGMKMNFASISKNIKPTLVALLIKCIVVPAILLVVIASFFDIGSARMQVTLLESAMPPMVMAVVFSQRYGLNTELAISAVALGIFASYAIIPAWFYLIT
jgi:malate permease and related proteins